MNRPIVFTFGLLLLFLAVTFDAKNSEMLLQQLIAFIVAIFILIQSRRSFFSWANKTFNLKNY